MGALDERAEVFSSTVSASGMVSLFMSHRANRARSRGVVQTKTAPAIRKCRSQKPIRRKHATAALLRFVPSIHEPVGQADQNAADDVTHRGGGQVVQDGRHVKRAGVGDRSAEPGRLHEQARGQEEHVRQAAATKKLMGA